MTASRAMRVMVALGGLAVATTLVTPMWAFAGGAPAISGASAVINPAVPPLPAPPRVPPSLSGPDPGIYQRPGPDRPRRPRGDRGNTTTVVVVPQPIYVAPNRCWYPGYWSYEWVPQWAAYSTWVDAGMSADGQWLGGHYENHWYQSGSYQPYWIDGSWGDCQ